MLGSAERSMGSDDAAEKVELNSLKREEGESSLLCVYIYIWVVLLLMGPCAESLEVDRYFLVGKCAFFLCVGGLLCEHTHTHMQWWSSVEGEEKVEHGRIFFL